MNLSVEAVASALELTHDSMCTFFACPGTAAPPVHMATCSHHWAYHDLREAVGDKLVYEREGHAPISFETYIGLLGTERLNYTPAEAVDLRDHYERLKNA